MPQFKVRIDLSGEPAIQKALNEVKTGVFNRAMRQSLRKLGSSGTKLAKQKLRAVSKRRTGQLDRAMGFRVQSYRRGGVLVLVLGPRRGFKVRIDIGGESMNVDPVKYGHLVEGGRRPVRAIKAKALRLVGLKGFRRGRGSNASNYRNASALAAFQFRSKVRAAAARPFMEPAHDDLAMTAAGTISTFFQHELKLIEAQYARKGKSILK